MQAGFARPVQDMGIRIEGPGATYNTLVANTVTNSAVANANGFILYSDTSCTVPVGSGTGIASGDGTMTPVISFGSVTGALAFTIAAGSVDAANTAGNPPVPNSAFACTTLGSGSEVPGL